MNVALLTADGIEAEDEGEVEEPTNILDISYFVWCQNAKFTVMCVNIN